jgi:hypothetical protein
MNARHDGHQEEEVRSDAGPLGWLPTWVRSFLGLNSVPLPVSEASTGQSLGAIGILSIWGGCMLLALALANNASLRGEAWANSALWMAIAALVWPFAVRLVWPGAGERERIGLIVGLGMALYLVRILHNPTAFVNHDEFLHWRTVDDILAYGKLFTVNPLLPISPQYPGLELATAAIVQVTGLSVFAAGAVVIGLSRLTFLLSAYSFFRDLTDSTRIAATATLLCMASSNFVFFHGQFAYESLAFALAMVCLAAALRVSKGGEKGLIKRLPLFILPTLALAMTHHLTAYYLAGILSLVTLSCALLIRRTKDVLILALLSTLAIAISLGWQILIGNQAGGYLWPVLIGAFDRIREILATGSLGRELFVSAAGEMAPRWQRIVTLASVALIGLGLVTGTLRTWFMRDARQGAWVAVLIALAAAYPFCVIMRLDGVTWEIGNRLGTFVFIAVALVMAHSVVGLWPERAPGIARATLVGSAIAILLVGGMVAGDGPLVQPGPYLVGGDNRAVEAQGINAARWTREQLGENHIFAADRINRLLTSVYGRQRLITSLYDGVDVSSMFLLPELGEEQLTFIDRLGIEYAVVDTRLASRLPFVGHYYEMQEMPGGHTQPASLTALEKFDGMTHVNRIYDSGDIAIYDLRDLHGRR